MTQKKFVPGGYHFKVKRAQPGAGLALFTEDPIKKGACIIEYVGRTISKQEEYTSRSKYLFGVGRAKTIDGGVRSNTARYINHSCVPNAEVEIWGQRVYVMARKNIKAGEEITYDYGKEYFDEHIKPIGCRCPKHLALARA